MEYRVDLVVLSEQKQNCRFGLTFHNLSDQDLHNWSLIFAFDRYILPDSISNGQLKQIGSYCTLKPEGWCWQLTIIFTASSVLVRIHSVTILMDSMKPWSTLKSTATCSELKSMSRRSYWLHRTVNVVRSLPA